MCPASSIPSPGTSASQGVFPWQQLPNKMKREIFDHADVPTSAALAYAGMNNSSMRRLLAQAIKQKGLPADLMSCIAQQVLDQFREHLLVPDAPARGAPLGIEHLNRSGKEALARSRYATGDLLAGLYEHAAEDIKSNTDISAEGIESNYNISFEDIESIYDILKRLGANPNTPKEILDQLAGVTYSGARRAVAGNESTSAETLDRLAGDQHPDVRQAVARNRSTPAKTLDRLAGDKDRGVRKVAAGNGSTPAETLDELVNDQSRSVREAVAGNESTPAKPLDRLADDKHSWVRRAVARNRSTPPETLDRLADDEDLEVREAVALNERTPVETVNRLAGDKKPRVRQTALRAPQMEKVVVQLLLSSRSQLSGS